MPRKLILVEQGNQVPFICDEYYPEDLGRVHLLCEGRYGLFDRQSMTLEFQKTVIDNIRIEYEATDWPGNLTDRSLHGIRTYFFGDRT